MRLELWVSNNRKNGDKTESWATPETIVFEVEFVFFTQTYYVLLDRFEWLWRLESISWCYAVLKLCQQYRVGSGAGACRGLMMSWANFMLPTRFEYGGMWNIQVQQNCLSGCCHVKKDYATWTSPQVKIKKRKKLYESRTTLRNSSKGRERCETYVQGHEFCMEILVRKRCGTFQKERWYFAQKNSTFLTYYTYSAESALTASNDVLFEKFTILFWSFLQKLKAMNLSPNRLYGWYSPVTKFALPLKMKPSRQHHRKLKTINAFNTFQQYATAIPHPLASLPPPV